MSSIKAPATLRAGRIGGAREASSAGLAACLMVASSTVALAQSTGAAQPPAGGAPQATPPSSGPAVSAPATAPVPPAAAADTAGAEQLPALTIEAKKKPSAAPKASSDRPAAKVTSAPAAQPAPQPAQPAVADTAGSAAPNGNPYADPNAPYKVDRSASGKLTQPLLDTPKTVVTVPKEVLQDKGATSMRELARTTPGVTLGTGEGGNPFGDRVFIRGFEAKNDAYINGIRDSGVPIRESFNTEQVEILKGPNSSVGGRGTTGGAINIITKQAADKDFTIVTTTLGTDETKRGTLDYNKVLSKEWAVRINGMWQDANVAGRDEVYDNRWGGSVALLWKPTNALKFTADYYHLRMDALPDWGVPWDSVGRQPFPDSGTSREAFYGYVNRDFQKNTQDILTLNGELKLSDGLVFNNRIRYGYTVMDYIAALPQSVTRTGTSILDWRVNATPQSKFQTNEMLADQFDLTAKLDTFGLRHTVVTGAEISRERITRDNYSNLLSEAFGSPTTTTTLSSSLMYPNTGLIPFDGDPRKSGLPTRIEIGTKSAYLLDTIKLTDQWIVNGGVRLDHYMIESDQLAAGGRHVLLERTDLMLNYSAGITFKPVPEGSIYVAYGTASNPVGQEVDAGPADYGGLTAGSALLAPEENTSKEIGTKWELFGRRLLATAAVFETEKSNAREVVGQTVLDTGKYKVRGLEFGWQGNITSALSVYGGWVLMESKVEESIAAANVGRPFANIAHESFNLLAKYKINDWMTIGGQATYRGKVRGGTLAANNNYLDDYWRFDALAEFKLNEHYSLKLLGMNLTDEIIYDGLYRSATPFVYVAPGRAGYVTLEVKY
jgi:catecholate siderophore receptor